MKYLVTAAAAALMSAGAAQAAVYEYDVTLDRTQLIAPRVEVAGDGTAPNDLLPGLTCDQSSIDYSCSGNLNFSENTFDIDFLENFGETINVKFRLEEDVSFGSIDSRCTETNFICNRLPQFLGSSADETGFDVFSDLSFLSVSFDELGLSYASDSTVNFNYDGINYVGDAGGGLRAEYTVADLQIAPVPLPASLPLLAIGLAGLFGLRRARKPA